MAEDANSIVISATGQGRLKSFVERLERMAEDRATLAADTKELFAELTGEGFDAKVVRKVLKLRAQDKVKRQEEEAILDLYLSAIGEI